MRRTSRLTPFLACVLLSQSLLVGCSDPSAVFGDGGLDAGADTVRFPDAFVERDGQPPIPGTTVVYSHTDLTLYEVDPTTLAVTKIGDFGWPSGFEDKMTDIAVDKNGMMTGIGFDSVFRIDTDTAACTRLAPLSQVFNGLSYVTRTGFDGQEEEVLMATGENGDVFEIDPNTGASNKIGNYGGGLSSSGDLVSVRGFGTVATVEKQGVENDILARVNPDTGVATEIGDIGYKNVFGVGFWGNKVYGFTSEGNFLLIDVTTGAGTLQQQDSFAWWGAGVTTRAKVIE